MKEEKLIRKLYRDHQGIDPSAITSFPRSGSDRRYFRITSPGDSMIAALNPNREENRSFIGFTRHFRSVGLPVPEIYAEFTDEGCYFLQDLGDENLFTWLEKRRGTAGFDDACISMYRKVIDNLIPFQVEGKEGLDLDLCYPHRVFDRQSMMWDMNYFKYMFLKLVAVPFNEKRLEKEFNRLADILLGAGADYFLYRDFQSANIMVLNGEPWFIDYQGGRMGPPQYDIASLLYDSKAKIPSEQRELLFEHFAGAFLARAGEDESRLRTLYPAFALIRIMQALGAYGYRGLYEQKPGFAMSIVPAVRDLNNLMSSGILKEELPELYALVKAMSTLERFGALSKPERLKVTVTSFSYLNGMPREHVHGGGFVFDCRALPNHGKGDQYRELTGNDEAVKSLFRSDNEVMGFIEDTCSIVERSVRSYLAKNYTSLSVAYGCTGGRHRSVYCAGELAARLEKNKSIEVVLEHRDI